MWSRDYTLKRLLAKHNRKRQASHYVQDSFSNWWWAWSQNISSEFWYSKKDSERVCTPPLDEPFFLAFVNGLCEIGLGADNGRVGWLWWLSPFGLVGVVGAFMAEHVSDQKHQCAQNTEDHHCNDTCKENTFTAVKGLVSKEHMLKMYSS